MKNKTENKNTANLKVSHFTRSGIWVTAGSMTTMLSTLIICASIAKTHSPKQAGLFFLLLSVANFFRSFSTLGVPMASVRFLAEALAKDQHSRISSILTKASLFAAIGGVITFILIVLNRNFIGLTLFRNQGFTQLAILTGLWGVLAAGQTTVTEFQRGMGQIPRAVLTSTFPHFVVATLLVISVITRHPFSLVAVILLYVLTLAATVSISTVFLTKHTNGISKTTSRFHFWEIASVSMPIWVGTVTAFLFSRVNLWILSHYHGAGEVAVFGATIQLVVLSGFPLLIAMGTVAPNISALVARKNSHDLNLLLRTTAQIQFAASLAITFGILILGRFALQIVYGDFYKVGVLPMIILAFGYCFNAWTGLPGLLLNMSGHQKVSMTCGIIAVSLGIATSLLLVPQIGITGAAIGSSAGIIAQNLLMLLYCRISFRINTWANISMDSIRRIHRTLIFRKGNFSRF